MTLTADRPVLSSTATTPRAFLRRNRGLLSVAALVVGVLVLLVLVNGVGRTGSLDPDSYEPSGAHALAVLLADQGVDVRRTTDVPSTLDGAGASTTVFVPLPYLLTPEEISDLQGGGVHLVIAEADPGTVDQLGVESLPEGTVDEEKREPGCGLAAAEAAGTVRIGGYQYGEGTRGATRCYDGTLVDLPEQDLVLLGGSKALTNDLLGDQGNAELGLQLLGQHDDLRWLIPSPTREQAADLPARSINDLMPAWVGWTVVQLSVVLGVLVLWRGRRLGRVVPEPLPVVVRAAETVEGRGRMYRAASARAVAAESLRSGARDRLSRRLGAGRNPAPEVLADLVAARSSRTAPEALGLLYGPPPVDDAALVQLARHLDALTQEVSGS